MPNYTYACARGHSQDLVRPIGTETVHCACGQPAARQHVYHFDVVGPTVDTRGMFRRFTEASAEMEHHNQQGPTWKQAQRRADAMIAAGEAPTYKPLG